MTLTETIFLKCIRAGLCNEFYLEKELLQPEAWIEILNLAEEQQILPLVYEAAHKNATFRRVDKQCRINYQKQVIEGISRQAVQSNEFLTLLLQAQKTSIDPIVLKGITIRHLYPKPVLRPSVDEDILVSDSLFNACDQLLIQNGLKQDDNTDPDTAEEISYHKVNSPTYIEMHRHLFPSDSTAYGSCNKLFVGVENRLIRTQIEDVSICTLAPTDHLLYLICHAYKHFLHSGMGIRQVCDIGMFTRAYETKLDWKWILSSCKTIHIETFTAAIYQILHKYLGFEMPDVFSEFNVDETDLLEDILSGGMYGTEDPNRVRSSTITLEAVAASHEDRKNRGVLHSLFLPRKDLERRYPYLSKYPFLLPAAWGTRITKYMFQRFSKKVDPTESIRIGRERLDLLREYRIID